MSTYISREGRQELAITTLPAPHWVVGVIHRKEKQS